MIKKIGHIQYHKKAQIQRLKTLQQDYQRKSPKQNMQKYRESLKMQQDNIKEKKEHKIERIKNIYHSIKNHHPKQRYSTIDQESTRLIQKTPHRKEFTETSLYGLDNGIQRQILKESISRGKIRQEVLTSNMNVNNDCNIKVKCNVQNQNDNRKNIISRNRSKGRKSRNSKNKNNIAFDSIKNNINQNSNKNNDFNTSSILKGIIETSPRKRFDIITGLINQQQQQLKQHIQKQQSNDTKSVSLINKNSNVVRKSLNDKNQHVKVNSMGDSLFQKMTKIKTQQNDGHKINSISQINMNRRPFNQIKVQTNSQNKTPKYKLQKIHSEQKHSKQLISTSKMRNVKSDRFFSSSSTFGQSLISTKQNNNRSSLISNRQSQVIKKLFNKKIKQIKLRKYFHNKQQPQSQNNNIFQSYGSSIKSNKHSQNQDSIYFSKGIYVLCDGHGTNGKQISSFVCQQLHNSLNQCLQQQKLDQTILKQLFKKIDLELDNINSDVSFSGCTCIAVLRYQNNLFCMSVGDSKVILCSGYHITEISTCHKPDQQMQRKRIQNYGGVIKQTETSKDRYSGPMRIWAPGKNSWGPGLAMSRAFGDKASKKYGVISIPDINILTLTSQEQFMVMGSDGLFDYFSNHDVCQFVRKCLKNQQIQKQQISLLLVQQAKLKWIQNGNKNFIFNSTNNEKQPSEYHDDISCIIVFM